MTDKSQIDDNVFDESDNGIDNGAINANHHQSSQSDANIDGDDAAPRERGVSRDKKREIMRATLRHPSELTIAQDGSFADDGRAKLPLSENLISGMLYFSERDGRSDERRAYQCLLPVMVSIQGTDDNPVLTLTDGRQRSKAAAAINSRVESMLSLWDLCKHDKVKTRNALVSLAAWNEALRTGGKVTDLPKVFDDLTRDQRDELAWVNGETMTEELASLYVGGEVDAEKHPGLLRVGADKRGAVVPYVLKVKYGDADSSDARTLAISATLKNVQVSNLPSMEAEQIQRLSNVTVTGADGKAVRKYSDESIARFLACSVPTLHNKLLILHVEQAVRDAVDAGQISWTTLRNAFFHSHKRSNIQPLAPAEQIDLLNEMIHKGISKSTHAAAAGLVASQVGQGSGSDVGAAGTAGSAGTNVAPGDETVVRSAVAVGKRKNIGATLIGDAGYFARASARLELAVNESPDPDADDVYGDEIVNRRTNRNMITAAQCIILFLKNNDPAALDEFPILKDALTAALEVPAPVLPKRKATTAQTLCNGIRSAFEAWDGIRADERPEWPTSDDAALQTEIDKIAAAFETQDDGSEMYTTDKVDFAMTWGLALLDAESGQIAA